MGDRLADSTSVVGAEHSSGLIVEGSRKATSGEIKVQASEGIIQSMVAGGERVWYFTLNWIATHPFLTVLLCAAVAWWRWQSHMTKVKVAGMKSDYKATRERARVAPQSRRIGK